MGSIIYNRQQLLIVEDILVVLFVNSEDCLWSTIHLVELIFRVFSYLSPRVHSMGILIRT